MFGSGMIVDMFGIHFEEVLNAPFVNDTGTGSNLVAYDSIVIGDEAYAITKLEGSGIRVISKGLGSAGVEDPLDQRQSIGYKINGFGAKVLNAESVVNYWSVPQFEDVDFQANPTAWENKNTAVENPQGNIFVTFKAITGNSSVTMGSTTTVEVLRKQSLAQALLGSSLAPATAGQTIKFYPGDAVQDEIAATTLLESLTSGNAKDIFVAAS